VGVPDDPSKRNRAGMDVWCGAPGIPIGAAFGHVHAFDTEPSGLGRVAARSEAARTAAQVADDVAARIATIGTEARLVPAGASTARP